MKNRYFITGGAGFIGSHVCENIFFKDSSRLPILLEQNLDQKINHYNTYIYLSIRFCSTLILVAAIIFIAFVIFDMFKIVFILILIDLIYALI
jgi:hypothetical protein